MTEAVTEKLRIGIECKMPFIVENGDFIYMDVSANYFPQKFHTAEEQMPFIQSFLFYMKEISNLMTDIYTKCNNRILMQKLVMNLIQTISIGTLYQYLLILRENITFVDSWLGNCQNEFQIRDAIVFIQTKLTDCFYNNRLTIA